MQTPVVICGYKRSPFTFAMKGALAKTRPDDMAAQVIKALIADTGANADDIEDLLMGCAFPEAEQGFNLGKIVAQLADLPDSVAGATNGGRLYPNGCRRFICLRRGGKYEPYPNGGL